jgi:hypothetical protein
VIIYEYGLSAQRSRNEVLGLADIASRCEPCCSFVTGCLDLSALTSLADAGRVYFLGSSTAC